MCNDNLKFLFFSSITKIQDIEGGACNYVI